MKDGDSFGAGSYPTPLEEEEKHIKAKVYVSFNVEYDIPSKWNTEDILDDIKENINDLEWYDFEIDEIEL